nr:MAG TPA: hypothetical protein [Caudoviricetes sp.]
MFVYHILYYFYAKIQISPCHSKRNCHIYLTHM